MSESGDWRNSRNLRIAKNIRPIKVKKRNKRRKRRNRGRNRSNSTNSNTKNNTRKVKCIKKKNSNIVEDECKEQKIIITGQFELFNKKCNEIWETLCCVKYVKEQILDSNEWYLRTSINDTIENNAHRLLYDVLINLQNIDENMDEDEIDDIIVYEFNRIKYISDKYSFIWYRKVYKPSVSVCLDSFMLGLHSNASCIKIYRDS